MSAADRERLTPVVRALVDTLDKTGPDGAKRVADFLRRVLAEQGLAPGCHVGRRDMSPEEIVEWYAGQIVETIDGEAWFAINSIVNTCDKFCPAGGVR